MVQPVRLLSIGILIVLLSAGCLDQIRQTVDPVEPKDYIRDSEYKKWVIEVDYVQGMKPSDAWLDELRDKLREVVRKDTITVKIGNVLPGQDTWSDSDITGLKDRHQAETTSGDTVTTYVAYVDGRYVDDKVLGIAFGYDLIVIFKERIDEGCTLTNACLGNSATVQRAVLIHEFGHILGLVDRGVPMVNAHSDGGAHSNNRNSVMFASVESTGIFGLSSIPTSFDNNDKLDICAYGGKGSC